MSDIIFFILFIFIIVVVYSAIFGTKNKSQHSQAPRRQYQPSRNNVLQMQIDNRKRILNESCDLVEKSKNIDVIVRRKEVALEQLSWFEENARLGVTLNPSAEFGRENLLLNFNQSLLDRLEEQIEKQLSRAKELKTKSAKQNAKLKAIEIKNKIAPLFERSVSNYPDIEHEILSLTQQIESAST